MLKTKEGISLISLVITIIAIIIIAGISFFNGLDTPDTAIFSKFTEEISNIRVAVATVRARNSMEHNDENYGFKAVTLLNAPEDFVSFSNDASNKTGYVIDFDLIDYKPESRGMAIITEEEITFENDDVYVYDKNGAVYYVKGFANEDKIYYNAKCFE